MPTNRRKYDDEFKKRAVRLSYSSERPVTEFAKSLGNYHEYDLPMA